MTVNHPDLLSEVRDYMARNHWVASSGELTALGAPWSRIRSWVRSGRLVQLTRGVYGYGRDIETPESAWRAALLAAGPGAVLAGRSAGELWGYLRMTPALPPRILVASPRQKAVSLRGCSPAMKGTGIRIVHRSLDPGDLRRRSGLAVASPVWTLIEYAAGESPVKVKYAFLEACRLGHFRRADVDACFRQVRGRRGATRLGPLLALWVPELGRIRSVLEGIFLLGWVETGRPMPLVNHVVCGHEVDCYWPEHHLVVELDGARFHSDPLAKRRDAARDARLRQHGLRVVRYGHHAVDRHLPRVVREVEQHFESPPRPIHQGRDVRNGP